MILIFIVGILLGLIVWNRKALWAAYQRRKKEIQRKKPFQYEYQMGAQLQQLEIKTNFQS